ncbi:MAG: glutathione ABC transporter permease GsiC [Deltaproteobacteria bacterium CG07_land_8_20_14_0_80_38_7]|nr:MAG: glutathione ABC transporter permease GsiC [Deltaproteobacteria bacterium CG07_land_8_20_14_0_80_38_7]
MQTYLSKRLIMIIPILLSVATIVFFLIHVIPGDPVDLIVGEQALTTDKARIASELNLDKPVIVQYGIFLKGLVTGDWGRSLFDRRPVLTQLKERFSATALLAFTAMFIAVLVAIPMGVLAAVKRNSFWDSASMFIALVGISVPNFWLGPVLILLFSVYIGILPIAGGGSLSSIILPSITLGAALAAMLSRMTRASMIEEIKSEYITTARAKGISERKIIFKHAFKNALNPIITIVGLQVGALLAGTVITEKIFSWPGIGSLLMDSIGRRDYPVVEGCILLISFSYVIINMSVDLLYRFFDPRVKL